MLRMVSTILATWIAVTLTGGCASVGPGPGSRAGMPAAQAVSALLPDSLFPPAAAGIVVVSVTRGDTLFSLNPDLLFTPASNLKLLTSVAALDLLGPRHRFVTVLGVDTTSARCLVLRGSGDPLLTDEDLDRLASRPSWMPPDGFTWRVAGDVSAFDSLEWGKGWMWDDEPDPTAMFVSPLSVNGNAISVAVSPALSGSRRPVIALDPATDAVTVRNDATTTVDSVRFPLHVERVWTNGKNVIRITGEVAAGGGPAKETLSLRAPAQVALALLAERLRAHGVAVDTIVPAVEPAASFPLDSVSHTLDSVLVMMNKTSDNLAAEVLIKTMGTKVYGGPGNWDGGISAARTALSRRGVDTTAMVMADGSGISRYNLISARAFVELLTTVAGDSSLFPLFLASLPVAGRDGTLASRMRGTAAEGRVRAKTGTMTGTSSFSGYIETAGGELLAFSLLMGHYPGSARPYREVQDRIAAYFADLRR